jgi:hypothetical protein
MIDISDHFFEFFNNNGFLYNRFDLFNGFILVPNLNYFFTFSNNLFNLLNNNWNLNYLFNNILNISINVNDLRNNLLNLIDFRNFNNDIISSLNFINFRNSISLFYYFLNDLLSCNNLLYNTLYWDDLFNNLFNFFYPFSNIRYFLKNLSVLNIVNNLLFNS